MQKLFLAIIFLLITNFCNAQFLWFGKNKNNVDTTKTVTTEAKVDTGFFCVQKEKNDWYFIINDTLLRKPFLAITRFVSTPDGCGYHGGEKTESHVLYWEAQGDNLLLRALSHASYADSTDAVNLAVRNSTEDPILSSFKKEKSNSSGIKINVTSFIEGDNVVCGLPQSYKDGLKVSTYQKSASFTKSIRTYPINTEVTTVKTFAVKTSSKIFSAKETGLATFTLNTSFVKLPDVPLKQRFFDRRVGYFTESDIYFSDDQQQVRHRQYISRWRLEPKNNEDFQKQQSGELIEPKKPIVYYIDPATPEKWRKYLILGVEDWNVAFEQAGWKNAIRAEVWPDSAVSSMEDARFSFIRYLASTVKNAYGPHVSDPRTGEILNTSIAWYHNVMQLIHDWYIIQVGAVDTSAQKMVLPDTLMGELIRFVSSHEVGHTLGLRHNMGASSATPLDSLRNKEWVEKNGHTVSIMDYARFNYVAQPEDNIGAAGLMPRIGVYDKWAIEWGYKFISQDLTAEEERLLLNKMTVERLAADSRLWFGGEGRDADPRALTEDLSDDPIGAANYGIKNLKRILPKLPEWAKEEADDFSNLKQLYNSLLSQFKLYIGHAVSNIGGVYHEYKTVEQEGAVYWPEEKARMQRAIAFLDENILSEPTWLMGEEFIYQIDREPQKMLVPILNNALKGLYSASVIGRISAFEHEKDTYKASDYVYDVTKIVFRELYKGGSVDSWRRLVQRNAVKVLIDNWKQTEASEAKMYISLVMRELMSRTEKVSGVDKVTAAHCAEIYDMLFDAMKR